MNKPRLEDKDKVAKVYNSKGEVCETFSFRDHGNSYLSAAQNYLMQNYDKLMSESNDYFRRRKAEEDRIADKRDKHGVKLPPLRNPKQTDYEKMRKERKEQGLDEEVEQMDEGNKENKKKKNEYVSNIIKKKLSPEVLPSLKYGRRELKKEKVEQIDESSGDAPINKMSHKDLADYIGQQADWVKKNREEAEKLAHEKTEDLQEKLTSDMSLADVIRDFVHSDNKRFKGKSKEERIDMAKGAYYGMHENKIYTNVIAKLEEGRKPKPPAEGKKPSAAWLRQQEREKASGGKEPEKKKEPEHVVAQILKHQDYGYKDHEYTFHDGSKLNVTPEKRDKIIRKIQSLTGPGPGKSPEARKKLYDELNTRKGFLHHTGDEPIPVEKLHPMSAQKK